MLGTAREEAARELWGRMEEVIRRLLECRGWVCCHIVKSITAFDLKIQALKIKYDTDLCNMEIHFNASTFVVVLCLFLVQVCTCCQWKSLRRYSN